MRISLIVTPLTNYNLLHIEWIGWIRPILSPFSPFLLPHLVIPFSVILHFVCAIRKIRMRGYNSTFQTLHI
jgi:hypothetical protein